VSQEGEGRRTGPGGQPGVPGVMTFGAATTGEVLVDRYRLEEHIDTDTAGRQIWRGVDTVLRRPVALVIRQPGGEAAAGMLTVAVSASRLVHPHLVSVYDAIDEGHRAYLVREWVPGVSLRDVLNQSPLDSERAILVTHAIAEAVAALHAAGIVHGNIHPGTILIADDGRVVLLDAHADAPTDPEYDVRAIGAVLYACLTGHWPYAEAGRSTLPDAVRDAHGHLARPRQIRGGIPRHLDEIAAELLEPQVEPPPASALAAEFARLATEGQYDEAYDDGGYEEDHHGSGPMGFRPERGGGRRRGSGKLVLGIAALTIIAVIGVVIGVKALTSSPDPGPSRSQPAASGSAGPSNGVGKPLALRADQLRIVDPPRGDRTEFDGVEKVIDGNESTGWSTDKYNQAGFGGIKPGMGILINLGAPTKVTAVKVSVGTQGASISLRAGTSDPGSTSEGDGTIANTYAVLGPTLDEFPGTNMVLPVPESQQTVQYLLVWISKLPPNATGRFELTINEIVVLAP
jgi:eukaryotic-like serine/threonine-protein kinase